MARHWLSSFLTERNTRSTGTKRTKSARPDNMFNKGFIIWHKCMLDSTNTGLMSNRPFQTAEIAFKLYVYRKPSIHVLKLYLRAQSRQRLKFTGQCKSGRHLDNIDQIK